VNDAVVEKKLESGYIADIAITADGNIVAVVEVKVHHVVDETKKNNIGVPFVELLGEEVIENPLKWSPVTDKFKSFKCKECERAIARYNGKIKSISQQTKMEIPTIFYRTAYSSCWRCDREILIFVWPNDSIHNYILPDTIPRPKTVQYRYSKMAGENYWANTCPYCKSIQGDFFLFVELDSPLFGFYCNKNTKNGFKRDMKSLAIKYYRNY